MRCNAVLCAFDVHTATALMCAMGTRVRGALVGELAAARDRRPDARGLSAVAASLVRAHLSRSKKATQARQTTQRAAA
jgi:hypothetical protein